MSEQSQTTQIPEALARKADRRALEIFEREARLSRTFAECLGQVYMVGVKAGLDRHDPCIICGHEP